MSKNEEVLFCLSVSLFRAFFPLCHASLSLSALPAPVSSALPLRCVPFFFFFLNGSKSKQVAYHWKAALHFSSRHTQHNLRCSVPNLWVGCWAPGGWRRLGAEFFTDSLLSFEDPALSVLLLRRREGEKKNKGEWRMAGYANRATTKGGEEFPTGWVWKSAPPLPHTHTRLWMGLFLLTNTGLRTCETHTAAQNARVLKFWRRKKKMRACCKFWRRSAAAAQ